MAGKDGEGGREGERATLTTIVTEREGGGHNRQTLETLLLLADLCLALTFPPDRELEREFGPMLLKRRGESAKEFEC